jgi:hypothetical protein
MTNGRPRRQLSDQLDRLDSILDGLADALNESVAEAAKVGVKEAVREAIVQLMTDSQLRAALHEATAPATKKSTVWERFRARVRQGVNKVSQLCTAIAAGVTAQMRTVRKAISSASCRFELAWQLRKVVLVGVGIGLTVAAVSYVTTHGVAATLAGTGAAATAIAMQVGFWVRKTVRRLGLT